MQQQEKIIEQPKTNQNQIAITYLRKLFLPGLIALIFETAALFLDNSLMLIWLANIGLIAYIIWLLKKDSKITPNLCFWVGFATFLIVSFLLSVAKLIIYWKFWYFLNLVTEPLIYAILGGVICYLTFLIINKVTLKGGEIWKNQKNPKQK